MTLITMRYVGMQQTDGHGCIPTTHTVRVRYDSSFVGERDVRAIFGPWRFAGMAAGAWASMRHGFPLIDTLIAKLQIRLPIFNSKATSRQELPGYPRANLAYVSPFRANPFVVILRWFGAVHASKRSKGSKRDVVQT